MAQGTTRLIGESVLVVTVVAAAWVDVVWTVPTTLSRISPHRSTYRLTLAIVVRLSFLVTDHVVIVCALEHTSTIQPRCQDVVEARLRLGYDPE
jgi:hypothetical protein